MSARRSVWANDTVQMLLANFVPAADEVWRLQHRDGPECDLFRLIAEQGHYAGRTEPSDTRQGIYVTTPSGRLLASVNTRDPRSMIRTLERGLERWHQTPESDRYLAPDQVDEAPLQRRLERLYPEDGMSLRVNSRDIGRDMPPPDRRGRRGGSWKWHAWNQDYAWFRDREMRQFIPGRLEVGAVTALPEPLSRRLVRLHLVDNVRGQVSAFDGADVRRAEIRSRIVAIDEHRIVLAVDGMTLAVRPADTPSETGEAWRPQFHERGVETTMLGHAEYDRIAKTFTRFDLVAIGERWGGSEYNGRERDLDRAGIGFALTLAPADERIAPAYLWLYGWE